MKKHHWLSRSRKVRQELTPSVAATLREFIAKTWVVIGSLRKKRAYDTGENPWNPCLRARQNYAAWCRTHRVNPECWDNFVYYFGVQNLFRNNPYVGPSLPDDISIATMELEVATGMAAPWASYLPLGSTTNAPAQQESLASYEDAWAAVIVFQIPERPEGVRGGFDPGEEAKSFTKKITIRAKSYSGMSDSNGHVGPPEGQRWSVSYSNSTGSYSRPSYRSQTVIEYTRSRELRSTNATFGAWWVPILESLKPGWTYIPGLKVQVQPRTRRTQQEIGGENRHLGNDDDWA